MLIGFDCSHSVGTLPHRLDDWGVDFAFWCSCKYVSAGPGGSGGMYSQPTPLRPSAGAGGVVQFGEERQFDFGQTLHPARARPACESARRTCWSMAPLAGCLELIEQAGIDRIRRKSLALTDYLMRQIDAGLARWGFRVVTPRGPERRGGHVALAHPEAARIARAMRQEGVIPDFRPPNLIRWSPVALYTSFEECSTAVERTVALMERRAYEAWPPERDLVS